MNSSNQYPSPKIDAYEKALDGIDLFLKQNNPMNEKTDVTRQRFQQNRKQNSEFSLTGLWRKKRHIGQLKSNHAS